MRTEQQYWRKALDRIDAYALQRRRERERCAYERQKQRALDRALAYREMAARRDRECQLLNELSILNKHLTVLASERDAARRLARALREELEALRAPRVHRPPSRPRLFRASSAAAFMVFFGAMAGAGSLHNDPGYRWDTDLVTQADNTPAGTAGQSDDTAPAAATVDPDLQHASLRQSAVQRLKQRRHGDIEHRQWGPPLFPADSFPDITAAAQGFDPVVRQQQKNLLALGFDLGQSSADGMYGLRTHQALEEFRSLYLPEEAGRQPVSKSELTFLTGVYANMARSDAEHFGVDRGVVAAIRLSSVRTGVEFSFLMELADAESDFNPRARAAGSSAEGLYQFTESTWLNTIRKHGAKYGLGAYAEQIGYIVDRRGNQWPRIDDARLRQHVLDLRRNPRVAAMMAAESVKDYMQTLAGVPGVKPDRTELYLTHFLGPEGAVSFLKTLDENPRTFAVDLFPQAAQSNRSIFHPQTCEPRTVTEVYQVFSQKFHTSRFEDRIPD